MRNPAVETAAWDRVEGEHDAHYRAQLAYVFARSDFYRDKLRGAGLADARDAGGLDRIAALPLTDKDELRAGVSDDRPIGRHLAAPMADVVRIYSTSGTTGLPSYIPLTAGDLDDWTEISARSYAAGGAGPGARIVTTYNAGPFVAGVGLDALGRLGVTHVPVGAGNTERLMTAVQRLGPDMLAATPSYVLHLAEWARTRGIDTADSSVRRIVVAGEPGGGEPAMRAQLQQAWGAQVCEAMGIGDIAVTLWGECDCRAGMHFSGRGYVHFELIEPESGAPVALRDGAEGELVYTHLRQRAAPLLRFRSRDHVRLSMDACACGRTAPRVRCLGRSDDMLIVRGVNLFPSALREVVGEFAPDVSGVIAIRPRRRGVSQTPPLPVRVELAQGAPAEGLAGRIAARIRERLIVSCAVELVPAGSLPRSDYKSKLVDWSAAEKEEKA
jgi:phenylacetate-CoA ligase